MNLVKKYSILGINIILAIYIIISNVFSKESSGMNYDYVLTTSTGKFLAKNSVQIVLKKNKFLASTIIEENNQSIYEIKSTGYLEKTSNVRYVLSQSDIMIKNLNNSSPSFDSPIIKELYSSKRALKKYNSIEVIERKEKYNISITSLYDGQIIGMNKF